MSSGLARLALVLFVIGVVSATVAPRSVELKSYSFASFERDYNKQYATAAERARRASIFASNVELIIAHNNDYQLGRTSYYMDINKFADLTNAEFKTRNGRKTPIPRSLEVGQEGLQALLSTHVPVQDLPESLDWRNTSGVVTHVKDQGDCGSCWAFSAVESYESVYALQFKTQAPVLSEQQIVSCSPNPKHCGGDGGCDGSTQVLAYNYTMTAGLSLNQDYKYRSGDSAHTGKCRPEKIKPFVKNAGFMHLPKNNYTALMNALVNVGPIAISLAAGGPAFQFYKGGIVDETDVAKQGCGWDQDHGVSLVGYGTEKHLFKSTDYWIVRNSWSKSFGEEGYIRLKRYGEGKEPCGIDKSPGDGSACQGDEDPIKICGMCGILSDSSYPTGLSKV